MTISDDKNNNNNVVSGRFKVIQGGAPKTPEEQAVAVHNRSIGCTGTIDPRDMLQDIADNEPGLNLALVIFSNEEGVVSIACNSQELIVGEQLLRDGVDMYADMTREHVGSRIFGVPWHLIDHSLTEVHPSTLPQPPVKPVEPIDPSSTPQDE